MSGRTDGITVAIEEITPETAAELLGIDAKNRTRERGHVGWLGEQMTEGRFVLNGESVIIGENGEILDGQHPARRVRADGNDDRVRRRARCSVGSLRHDRHRQDKDERERAAGRRGQVREQRRRRAALARAVSEVGLWRSNPGITDSLRIMARAQSVGGFRLTSIAFAHYMCAQSASEERVAAFYDALLDDEIGRGPGAVLRRTVRQAKIDDERLTAREQLAMTVLAWNAHVLGEQITARELRRMRRVKDKDFPRFRWRRT